MSGSKRTQGIFWILTIPHHGFVPYLPPQCKGIVGQLERGHETGYLHWQLVVSFSKKTSLRGVRDCFGPYRAELTKSSAANDYCWKDDTAVPGTRFSLGVLGFNRSVGRDWDRIWESAQRGELESIPASVRVQSYRTLRTIASDYARPLSIEREVKVFWGSTGTGKSRRAWSEAGMDAYPKDPRSKFWCGYRDQKRVVIDEFRGG